MGLTRRALIGSIPLLLGSSALAQFNGCTAGFCPSPFGGGGGAPAFSPKSVSAVKYFLDARTIVGITDGSNITAASWTDQSQSNRGALATATAAVYRATQGPAGGACVEFNGTTSVCVSPAFSVTTPQRVFLLAKPIVNANQKYLFDGVAIDQAAMVYGGTSNGLNSGSTGALGIKFANTNKTQTAEVGIWSFYDVVFNGASSTVQVANEILKTDATVVTATIGGVTLGAPGNQLGGFFANLQIAAVIVCDSTLTGPQATQIRTWLAGFNIATRKMFQADGDSLTFGTNSSVGNDYPNQMLALLTGGATTWNKWNNGNAGDTIANMETKAVTFTDPFQNMFTRSVVIGWAGTNDIAAGTAGATAATSLATWCTNRRTAGADKIVIFDCIARGTLTGPQQTERLAFNAALAANGTPPWDALVKLSLLSQMSNSADTTYFSPDLTHLTDLGYGVVAGAGAPIVNGFG